MNASTLVQKLWNYCNVLRDDGLSYGDYVEQLTFLLFLKMADERTRPPFEEENPIPKKYSWPELLKQDGDELEAHYRHTLEALGKQSGIIGTIFRKAQNKIQDPAKLRRLIADLIDKEQWLQLDTDVKGDAYEGLLQKNAEDVKGGAGQYFTPRPLIRTLVEVMRPRPAESICDPACGTGRLSPRRARVGTEAQQAVESTGTAPEYRGAAGCRAGGRRRPPVLHEPRAARHRRGNEGPGAYRGKRRPCRQARRVSVSAH